MIHLIINADDFGLTQGINAAVVQAHKNGVLTSATLMAGGLAWQEAVKLARETPTLGVGVHLTLSALAPVLPPEEVPSLVDSRGRFRKEFWRAPLWKKDEVKKEWRAQIARLLGAGLHPTHLDSHHHTHLWPGLTGLVSELAAEFGIPALRAFGPDSLRLMGIGKLTLESPIVAASWRRVQKISQAKPTTVAAMEALPGTYQGLFRYLSQLGPGVHELYSHPGRAKDHDLTGISSLTDKRAVELEILCSDWLRQVLQEFRVELSSYKIFSEERV
jgi:hypothetical protein